MAISSKLTAEANALDRGDQLWQALKQKNTKLIKDVLADGASPNRSSGIVDTSLLAGYTPLVYVISAYQDPDLCKSVVESLLGSGADIDQVSIGGKTPLYVADIKQNINMFTYLLSHNAHVNIPDKRGNTVLMYLVAQPNVTKYIELLIAKKASLDIYNEDNKTALMIAREKNQLAYEDLLRGAQAQRVTC